MLRVCLTIVLPLLLPIALYVVWVGLVGAPRDGGAASWSTIPWGWLAGAGVVLLAIVLSIVAVGFGTTGQGVYVAPQWLNSRIVPGHFVPRGAEPPPRR